MAILLVCSALAGQSRVDLTKKYGAAASETFKARPGISVTATYGPTGGITELLIAPESTGLIRSKRNQRLSKDLATQIINELVSASQRGKFVMSTFMNIMCLPENDCGGTSDDYEKLTVYFNTTDKADIINYAVVQWKK